MKYLMILLCSLTATGASCGGNDSIFDPNSQTTDQLYFDCSFYYCPGELTVALAQDPEEQPLCLCECRDTGIGEYAPLPQILGYNNQFALEQVQVAWSKMCAEQDGGTP